MNDFQGKPGYDLILISKTDNIVHLTFTVECIFREGVGSIRDCTDFLLCFNSHKERMNSFTSIFKRTSFGLQKHHDDLKFEKVTVFLGIVLVKMLSAVSTATAVTCIQSKVGTSCTKDKDCYEFQERHLYCNKTLDANVCAFQVHTYASQSEENRDCPGKEFSAEPWSNPIPDDWMTDAQGVDCMRLCYLTKTCFAISIVQHKCYLKNEKCFTNLQDAKGALFGVLSVTREDYHCGCHYPFTRRSSNGEILSWDSDCPESQLSRNPYRCCSKKGLCVKCESGSAIS